MNILQGKNVFDVTGKVVIVTGAATGLGEGYAHIFEIGRASCRERVYQLV